MSVRKIRNSWWVDFRCEGVRYRKRSPENSQAGAKAYEAVLRARVSRGELIERAARREATPTLAEFGKEWLATWVPGHQKPSTAGHTARVLRGRLLPRFGTLRIDAITARDIERYKAARLARGLKAKTVNGELAVLRACLGVAARWSVIERVPETDWVHDSAPAGRFRFLTFDEAERLPAAADAPLWRDMITVALHTGLRYGELAALEWQDIDLAAKRIAVRRNVVYGVIQTPKGGKARYLPMTRRVQATLQARRAASGPVFPWKNGKLVRIETAAGALARACRRAGIAHIGWHALRHTFASHLVMRGVSLKAVQELLGHADIRMTMRYAHLAPAVLAQAVEVLDAPAPQNLGQPAGNAVSPVPSLQEVAIAA